mmetsp:Transcript_43041/g.138367  ORF Transcript_43041/g.138367 Transcript_43041/m.138367 type:complete len:187 (+) Transcript_43041:56-616(+)
MSLLRPSARRLAAALGGPRPFAAAGVGAGSRALLASPAVAPAGLPRAAGAMRLQARGFVRPSGALLGPKMDAARKIEDARAAGGKPDISVVTTARDEAEKELGISAWNIWEKEVSTFEWFFAGTEITYVLEGEATVTPNGDWSGCQAVSFRAGDLVTFPAGMTATWVIKAPIKKHLSFPWGKPLAK